MNKNELENQIGKILNELTGGNGSKQTPNDKLKNFGKFVPKAPVKMSQIPPEARSGRYSNPTDINSTIGRSFNTSYRRTPPPSPTKEDTYSPQSTARTDDSLSSNDNSVDSKYSIAKAQRDSVNRLYKNLPRPKVASNEAPKVAWTDSASNLAAAQESSTNKPEETQPSAEQKPGLDNFNRLISSPEEKEAQAKKLEQLNREKQKLQASLQNTNNYLDELIKKGSSYGLPNSRAPSTEHGDDMSDSSSQSKQNSDSPRNNDNGTKKIKQLEDELKVNKLETEIIETKVEKEKAQQNLNAIAYGNLMPYPDDDKIMPPGAPTAHTAPSEELKDTFGNLIINNMKSEITKEVIDTAINKIINIQKDSLAAKAVANAATKESQLIQINESSAAQAVAIAATMESPVVKINESSAAQAVAIAATMESPVVKINESAAAQAVANAATMESPVIEINESAAAQAVANAATMESPVIEINENAAAQAVANAATIESPVIEIDENAAAQAVANAATIESPVIEIDENAAAQAVANAATMESPGIEINENAAAQAVANAATMESPVVKINENAAAQAVANAATMESPSIELQNNENAAAQAVANAATMESLGIEPNNNESAAAQAVANAATMESLGIEPNNNESAAAQAIANAATIESPVIEPNNNESAAQQAQDTASTIESPGNGEQGATTLQPNTDNSQSQPQVSSFNLLDAIKNTLSGLFPKLEFDKQEIVNKYKKSIFDKLKKNSELNESKISENIRLITRQLIEQDKYFCVFLVHKEFLILKDFLPDDDTNKSDYKIYFALFNSSNEIEGDIKKYPPEKTNPPIK